MIIQLAARKGGCGKSTLASNIAASLASQGHSIALLDGDDQLTLWQWAEDRKSNKSLKPIPAFQKRGLLRQALIELNRKYDYVITDSAGRSSAEMRSALVVADIVIIPTQPSQADIDTLKSVEQDISEAMVFNTKLVPLLVFNRVPQNFKDISSIKRIVRKDYPALTILATTIADRQIYRNALPLGRGVTDISESGAKLAIREIKLFENEVFKYAKRTNNKKQSERLEKPVKESRAKKPKGSKHIHR